MTDVSGQRRDNVRISVRYPIVVHVQGHPRFEGRCRDISATGVGFTTRLPVEVGESGRLTVSFPTWELEAAFVVRFSAPILAGRRIGAEYVDLGDDLSEKVAREVFALQRQHLQEGSVVRDVQQ